MQLCVCVCVFGSEGVNMPLVVPCEQQRPRCIDFLFFFAALML